MSLLDFFRAAFSGRDTQHEETFGYRCRDCDCEFESPQRHVTAATCPDCGSGDVRVRDPFE